MGDATADLLEHYMSLPYQINVYPEKDGDGFTAKSTSLPGCMTCADTLDELWDMIAEAKELWLEVALADGDFIPEPLCEEELSIG